MSKDQTVLALKAWAKWARVTGQPTNTHTLYEFAKFIGDPHDEKRGYIVNIKNPEVMRKVELILGPNGTTLLKMWEIQRKSKDEL